MTRTVNLLLVLCVAAASVAATASPKNPDVERTVKSQLAGKVFATKILVGSYIPCPQNVNQSGRNDAIKMIDTELSPDGGIRYFARAGCSFPGGFSVDFFRSYVDASFSGQIIPGTSVWVRNVDFKNDRIEINLSTNNSTDADGSGKIKYMLGTAYRTWSADEVMEAIARGIQIPAYEQLIQLKAEFDSLRSNLDLWEKEFNAPGKPPAEKLVTALDLKRDLEQLQKNRAAFMALGKSDPQAGIYTQKLNALLPEIATLSEEARKQRVAHLRDQLQAQLPQITQIQAKVRQKLPTSLSEWQQRTESLSAYADLLDIRNLLLESLKSEKETPTPDDIKFLSDGRAEIVTARQNLENNHQQIELNESASQYEQLSKKRAQLLNSYLSAFGTTKERPALQNLAVVLGQIVTNREQAVAIGDKAAAAQLIKCRAEADKYGRKINPNDPSAAYRGHSAGSTSPAGETPRKVNISANEAVGLLLQKSQPVYSPIAKAARVSGTVVLRATISRTGSISDLSVVSGPPLLQGAALDTVKTWVYKPYLLAGKPVDVETTINVVFALGN